MPVRINDATPIAMLTVGQLEELTRHWVRGELAAALDKIPAPSAGKRHEYGLDGLCKILGCGRTTASKLNSSGIIDAALFKKGNKYIYDTDLVLQLLKEHDDARKAGELRRGAK